MTVDAVNGTLLYFEDDDDMAKMIADFLTGEGYQVVHESRFPDGGIEALRERLPEPPAVVLLDVRLSGMNGYEICRCLREDYLPDTTPIIFISGMMQTDDILQAYKSGADDYLVKPIRMQELLVKLTHYRAAADRRLRDSQQMDFARKMAFEAMATSSELGEILRFYDDSTNLPDLQTMGKRLLQTVNTFEVRASLQLWKDQEIYCSDDDQQHPLEIEVMRLFRNAGRIHSWKNRTFFNYEYFTLLIRNMPVHDEHRYGVLKDQFCLLLNGFDSRVHGFLVEQHSRAQRRAIAIIATTIGKMVMEMEQNNVDLSAKFEQIILDMETKVNQDILKFNLLQSEEQVLLDHLHEAISASTGIFESSLAFERQYRDTMTRLLENLAARQRDHDR